MNWPFSFDGLSYNCINVHNNKKVKLINLDCLTILMLLLFNACLLNVVCCFMLFVCIVLFLQMLSVFMNCLGLLTHSFFISSVILHHSQ